MSKYSRLNASVNMWNQETDRSCRKKSQTRFLTQPSSSLCTQPSHPLLPVFLLILTFRDIPG